MEYIDLNATTRSTTGNGPARRLRVKGKFPAILYGRTTEPKMLTVDAHEFDLGLKQGAAGLAFFNLIIEGDTGTKRLAMVKELQRHTLTGQVLHADFYEVDLSRKLAVNVPVITTGKSVGVELGGLMQLIRRELELFCLPDEIPDAIEIDITDLDIGDSVHVEDIQLEGDVEIPHDVNFTVVTVLAPKKEEEEELEEEEGEELEGEEAETAEGEEAAPAEE